jgi:hypothetical protein
MSKCQTEWGLHLKALVGSRAYNLHTEDSDYDYRYVVVSPLRNVISPFQNQETKVSIQGQADDVVWELRHFTRLCTKGNPSTFEVLFATTDLQYTPLLQPLVENRVKLLDAHLIFEAHKGYAKGQVKKLMTADEVLAGDREDLEFTTNKDVRRRKAQVAALRMLGQGAIILDSNGDYDPWIDDEEARQFFMAIKTGEKHLSADEFKGLFNLFFEGMVEARAHTQLTHPDYEWIEDYLLWAYTHEDRPEPLKEEAFKVEVGERDNGQ